jgi:hypothetical protein
VDSFVRPSSASCEVVRGGDGTVMDVEAERVLEGAAMAWWRRGWPSGWLKGLCRRGGGRGGRAGP